MATDTAKVLETHGKMTVLELVELKNAIEEEWGVTAAAPVAAAAPAAAGGGGDGAAAEEKSSFDVVVTSAGDKKIQVIKVVRAITGLGRVALLLQLLDPGVDQPDEIAERCRQQCDDGRERRDDRPHELCPDDVGRRQLGEALDLGRRQRLSLEHAPADREDLRARRRVGEGLRDGDRVAAGLDERDRRRPFEQREQRIRAGRLGRASGERVLDDREAGAVLEELRAKPVDLGVREPAVVGDDQRLRRPQPLRQLCDDSLLVTLLHLSPP